MTNQTAPQEQEMEVQRGLADVVAAHTRVGHVDGAQARLWYCGYDAIELAEKSTYEEVVYLLLAGNLPTAGQLEGFRRSLARYRNVGPAMLQFLRNFPGAPNSVDALRTMVSAMVATDASPLDKCRQANMERVTRIIAMMPTLMTAHWRLRQGEEPIAPRSDLGHAANLYYMQHGRVPSEVEVRVMNVCLILMAEHNLNASTFAARVVASTLSDVYAAFTAGIGALNGPLHGAANTEAMKMLLEVDQAGDIDAYVQGALTAKRRIMGFGHRVYRGWDARAAYLRQVLAEINGELPGEHWYELAEKVRETVFKYKQLYPNVDFYAAPAFYGLGFPMEMFTAIFACARSAGWGAHVLEQYADNRLIRPAAVYVGPTNRTFLPVSERR